MYLFTKSSFTHPTDASQEDLDMFDIAPILQYYAQDARTSFRAAKSFNKDDLAEVYDVLSLWCTVYGLTLMVFIFISARSWYAKTYGFPLQIKRKAIRVGRIVDENLIDAPLE
jgi:hypothetical protein